MKKVLITGAAGYIGSHATRALLKQGYEVLALDNFSHGMHQALEVIKSEGDLQVFEADLLEAEKIKIILEENKPEMVFHFAALCSVDESMSQPELYFKNNFLGTLNLLEAMCLVGTDKLIFSSTCAVYDKTENLPIDENFLTKPISPYAESKLAAEKMIKWFGQAHNLKSVIFRYFNVCGAASDGVIGDSKKPSLLLMQNAVRGIMGIDDFKYTCAEADTPDGTPIRDYIDVEDLVEAHVAAADYLNQGGASDIFNLGKGSGYSVKEIVSAVEKYFDKKLPEQTGQTRHGEMAQIYADAGKAQRILKWQAKRSLEDSIAGLALWYEKYPNGFDF